MRNIVEDDLDTPYIQDLRSFADLSNREIEDMRQQFLSALSDNDDEHLRTVADELAHQLGLLSARIRLIEEAAEPYLSRTRQSAETVTSFSGICNSDPDYISRHFSLMMYLGNLFRNRPRIVGFFSAAHRFLSRMLKLP